MMHIDYLNPAIRQLRDQQVRFAPREKRVEQVSQAEKLLRELDPARTYTYEYLCFRITNYRPESYPGLKLTGDEAGHDLRLFVEDLSESANVSAESVGERVMTVEELAKEFNVSTKTIFRWRRHGLISRRFVMDGRKRVGFLQSSVAEFVEQNRERVRRGSQFSQLSEAERSEIVERARRFAQAGACAADVTKRLAAKMSRSIETIRYTLKQFDREPGEPRPVGGRSEAQDFPAVPSRRFGRGSLETVLPHADEHLSRDLGDACAADPRIAVGLHCERRVRTGALAAAGAARDRAAAGERDADQEIAAAERIAAVFGELVRGAALVAETRSPSVPEDELSEVQGGEDAVEARRGPS
jgi:DNA-binding transcriptional MerR regulator